MDFYVHVYIYVSTTTLEVVTSGIELSVLVLIHDTGLGTDTVSVLIPETRQCQYWYQYIIQYQSVPENPAHHGKTVSSCSAPQQQQQQQQQINPVLLRQIIIPD